MVFIKVLVNLSIATCTMNLLNPENGSKLPSGDFANPPNRYLQFHQKAVHKMKFSIFLVLFSNFLFAQTEQISLDFFAENLLPKIKNAKVFYDGKVIDKIDYEKQEAKIDDETIVEIILWDYSRCKRDSRGISNTEFNFKNNFELKKMTEFANLKNSTAKNLTIPKNIKFIKELETKKRKSGKLRYKINKILVQKFNLKISPSIQIAENTFLTRIYMNKQDYEYGQNFDIIVTNGNVVDWCENFWIQ